MKSAFILILMILMSAVLVSADDAQPRPSEPGIVRVATSLDHLTVLEFNEPVTMAAAGSSAFQIERHENRVFIKPLKPGASTDLFVWTASRRFAYELLPPGDVQTMNFAIDSPVPTPKAAPVTSEMDGVADMMITRTLLGAERIDSGGLKDKKKGVTVRIQSVLRSRNTLYIHYSVRNLSAQPCVLAGPEVVELGAAGSAVSLDDLERRQLTEQQLESLGEVKREPLSLAHSETQSDHLLPAHETEGVLAVRQQVQTTTVIQLSFKLEGGRQTEAKATVVF